MPTQFLGHSPQDAYQRTLEIFMANADRLDPDRVAGWLHVVVKREAQAICRSRKKMLGTTELDPDSHEAQRSPSLEDRILSQDLVGRAAEALQRLKPQELRAVWLKAEGVRRQANPERRLQCLRGGQPAADDA